MKRSNHCQCKVFCHHQEGMRSPAEGRLVWEHFHKEQTWERPHLPAHPLTLGRRVGGTRLLHMSSLPSSLLLPLENNILLSHQDVCQRKWKLIVSTFRKQYLETWSFFQTLMVVPPPPLPAKYIYLQCDYI